MKKILLLFLLFSLSASIYGEIVRDIKVTFNKDDFSISIANKIAHISTNKFLYTYENDPRYPALPLVCVSILIGPDEEMSDFSYTKTEQKILDDIYIAACPEIVPTNMPIKQKTGTTVSYSHDTYPQTYVSYLGCNIIDGYKCIAFNICPFRYDDVGRKLYFEKDFTLKLSLQTNTSKREVKRRRNDDGFINSFVANPEDIRLYDNLSVQEGQSQRTNNQYEYAIITNNNLKSTFQKLANWKTLKGVKTTVLTVEQINSTYSSDAIQQIRIKKAIKNLYNSNESTFKYVLLAGDVDIVPSQMCLVEYVTLPPSTTYKSYCPTDLYYACLKTMDWDSNGNGMVGDFDDIFNKTSDIAVTRAPVSTINDAEAFVNRIISYESFPNVQTWNNNILLCGNILDSLYNYNGVIMSDTHYKGKKYYTEYIAPYWTGDSVSFYDTGSYLGANYNFNPYNIQKELSKGYTFVNEDSHGYPFSWETEDSLYSGFEAEILNNSNHTIIITTACLTNAFDSIPKCLSEAFIRNPNSGIIAYFGCSRNGWAYNDSCSIGASSIVNSYLYKYIFTDNNNNFGEVVKKTKNDILFLCDNKNIPYRWLLFGLNPIGDPEMPIFINTPQKFTNVTVSFSNGTLTVNSGVSGCKICVASANDVGNSYYDVRSGSSATFSNLTDDYSICITKPGYIPYLARCGNTVYLQNESIIGDLDVFSTQTYAGSNVITNRPTGPVEINKGSTIIRGTNGVTISDSFEVKDNASLEIRTN